MFGCAVTSVRFALAVVLGASAMGKLWNRKGLDELSRTLRLGLRLPMARLVTTGWLAIETATAVGLLLPTTFGYAAAMAVLVFSCLTVGAALLAAQHRGFSCNCFGVRGSQLSRRTVLRNGVLTGAALFVAVAAWSPGGGWRPAPVSPAAVLTLLLALGLSLLVLRWLQGSDPTGSTIAVLPASGPDLGSPALRITAGTEEAQPLDTEQLSGRGYLLAFYSSSCLGCRAALPAMIGYAGERFDDPRQLIAVIVGDRRQGADIASALDGRAIVVHEPVAGPISTGYRINLFPSYVLVSEAGIVLATGQSVRDLPQRQPR